MPNLHFRISKDRNLPLGKTKSPCHGFLSEFFLEERCLYTGYGFLAKPTTTGHKDLLRCNATLMNINCVPVTGQNSNNPQREQVL